MDLTWNLDSIYTSFDSENFKNDINQLNEYISIIKDLNFTNTENKIDILSTIEEYLKLNNNYRKIYFKLFCYVELLVSADSQNIEAINRLDYFENRNAELTEVSIRFIRFLKNVEHLDDIINSSTYLTEHKFYLKECILKSKYLLSEKEEVIISKMQITGAKAWERLYMQLISSVTEDININGKVESLPDSELRCLLYEKDSSLRKTAYLSETNLCKNISQVCANCINGISGEALTIYEMKGYKSPLEKVLINSKMDVETLYVMMSALEESLPIFHKYFLKKAEILGYKTNLPFYDMYAPIGDINRKVSYMEAKDIIVSSFSTFSEKLASFATKVFNKQWIDAEPRKGKGNFGLEQDFFPIHESRIMTSFRENYIDIVTLAHEIGHAYHSSNLFNQTMLNTEYPTPLAETASIFCETLVNNELLKILPNNEALVILERSISDASIFIVEFYGRYLFENQLFQRRKMGSLTVEELNEIMLDSIKKAYGDSIEADTISPYMWLNKPGYFMVGNEYLNFPYSFGILFSRGLYAEYVKAESKTDKKDTLQVEFVNQYDNFLSKTSTNTIVDVARILNIDVHSIEFWRNSLKLIESDIEKLIQIA